MRNQNDCTEKCKKKKRVMFLIFKIELHTADSFCGVRVCACGLQFNIRIKYCLYTIRVYSNIMFVPHSIRNVMRLPPFRFRGA